MDLRKCLLINNDCYKAGVHMTPKGIMWHSTGANNPNLKRYVQPDDGLLGSNPNGNDWNRAKPDGREVCVHAFIGKDKNGTVCIYQTLPFDMRGWHAGGSANNSYIGFEICEDALTDVNYFNAAYQQAVEFSAYLCKMYGLNPLSGNTIICHQDGYKLGIASNHSDVYHWFNKFGKTMDNVRNDVASAMGGNIPTPTPAPSKSINDIALEVLAGKWGNGSDRTNRLSAAGYDVNAVQKRVNELLGVSSDGSSSSSVSLKVGAKVTLSSSAQTYATGEKIPNSLKGKTYTIQQVGSGKVLLKELYSWVKNSDIVGASSSNSTSKPTGTYKVTASDLIVRDAPAGNPVGHNGLTADGKNHDKDKDGALDYGTQVTVKAWHGVWAEIPSGFVHGDYLVKV